MFLRVAAGPYFGHNPVGHLERSDGHEPPNYRRDRAELLVLHAEGG